MLIRLISVVIVFLSATASVAQDSVDQMLAQGRYAEALTATDVLLTQRPDWADAHVMRGYALLGLGQVAAAQEAAVAGVGSENAFLYAMLRGHIAAQSEHHNVANFWYRRAHDAAATPAQTQAAVAFSQQAQALRRWVWGAEFSTQYSDNINFATDQTEVRLGGIPFTLAEDNTARAGTTISGAFSTKYKVINDSNHLMQFGALASLSFEKGEGITSRGLGLTLDGQYRFLASDKPYTLHYGLSATRHFPITGEDSTSQKAHVQISSRFTETLGWSAGLNINRSFDALSEQTDLSLSLGLNGAMSGGHSYSLNYTRGRVTTENANAAADHQTLRVGITPQIDALPFTMSHFADYSRRDFTKETPFFGGMRQDTTITYGVTITPKDFSIVGMAPTITWQRSNRNSNVDINDATSQDVFIGLRSSF